MDSNTLMLVLLCVVLAAVALLLVLVLRRPPPGLAEAQQRAGVLQQELAELREQHARACADGE